jgi:tRNA(Ile)-lysidine synthase
MTGLAARVHTFLARHRLIGSGDRVVVAVSGGPDSVALTLLLLEVLPALDASVAGLAHFHHGLRGAEADADERFCREFAATQRLPCVVERADVATYARSHRLSIEAAGHRLRREFFARARRRLDATRVATGHTKDDLAETFLMRALRGSALRGLAGIRRSRGRTVRPLLELSRDEVVEYLAERAQPYRDDASNRDLRISRNRVRHRVMPCLHQHVSPRSSDAMARTAQLVADDEDYLRRRAARVGARIVLSDGSGLAANAAQFSRVPLAIRRRIVVVALERLSASAISAAAVDRVLELVASGSARRDVRVCGVRVSLMDGRLLFRRAVAGGDSDRAATEWSAWSDVLAVPGAVTLPHGGRIQVCRATPDANGAGPDRSAAVLDAARIRAPLTVRFWRPGDRVRPLGMTGRKKLQDLFVDRKVPRQNRGDIPLVVDADERILWVVGHVVAEDARVTSATTSVLLLQYRR